MLTELFLQAVGCAAAVRRRQPGQAPRLPFLRPGGGEGGGGEGGGDKVELEMRVTLVDGDEVIADSERDGSFENMCHTFREFVAKRVNASKE